MTYRLHESDDDPTYAPYRKAAASPGSIYLYGCPVLKKLKKERDEFVELHGGTRFPDRDPWLYQYDLELFCFLEYNELELQTNLPREEHFWRAVAIRWPMERTLKGRPVPNGKLYRNPWGEEIVQKACHYSDITIMGGSGQGKTTTPLAMMLMLWEQFIETPTGARGLVASVSEEKLYAAAWSALTGLDRSSKRGVSKYIGRGEILASRQVRRPNLPGETEGGQSREFKKDHRGIIATALVGGNSGTANAQKGVDKLSGAHVPTLMFVVLDEYQSMPDTAEEAVVNLFTHPVHKWIFKMGNPNLRDDNLGKSAEPIEDEGWASVNHEDTSWECGSRFAGVGVTVHFNNDHSPGMEDPHEYHYLPTLKKKKDKHPEEDENSVQLYRMWYGWFPPEIQQNNVVTMGQMRFGGALAKADMDREFPVERAASVDSAPTGADRTPLVLFSRVVERETGRILLSFDECMFMKKTYSDSYFRETGRAIVEHCKQMGVPSGSLIYDNSSTHGLGEEFHREGMMTWPHGGFKYQSAPSEAVLNMKTNRKAKDECHNAIAEAALLFSDFVYCGQVRGLTDDFCDNIVKEITLRRWATNIDGSPRIGKKMLEEKAKFRKRNGFSPDVLDCLFQAAYYARHVWGMVPGTLEKDQQWRGGKVKEWEDSKMSVNSIYESDLSMLY